MTKATQIIAFALLGLSTACGAKQPVAPNDEVTTTMTGDDLSEIGEQNIDAGTDAER